MVILEISEEEEDEDDLLLMEDEQCGGLTTPIYPTMCRRTPEFQTTPQVEEETSWKTDPKLDEEASSTID